MTSTLGEGWWFMFHFSFCKRMWIQLLLMQLWVNFIERRFQARFFKICKMLRCQMDFTCPGFVRQTSIARLCNFFLDWSMTCKRFYFHVELPQDQDMGTSLIHTSTFEIPINSFGCEVTSWWHYITSRERVKYHVYFPCMCHTYFTYILLTYFGSSEKRLHQGKG